MKSIQLQIILGTILVLLSAAILIIMGVREPARLAEFEVQQRAEQIEFGASVFVTNCTACHGSQAQGLAGRAPSLRSEEFFTERLQEIGWGGSLEDYIVSVVTVGRQVSTRPELYPGGGTPAMPTWSEKFGGPLRDDQIRAVAAFIMNFESYALGLEPTAEAVLPPVDESDPASVGRAVFLTAGCTACHTVSGLSTGNLGPVLDGLASRADDRVPGLSAEEYIRQSLLEPDAYLVEGFENIMPADIAADLSEEDLDSLVAFLLTLE
jgi:mono/diheme cytochrome c family protein